MPIKYREINLVPSEEEFHKVDGILNGIRASGFKEWVIIHAGKHWQSKTFPKVWWDKVLDIIKASGAIPILVGGHAESEDPHGFARTTVNVNSQGCLDLRGKLQLMETVALVKRSKVVLTNDSSVIHLSAPSDAWIGFITLAKHPDYLKHFRKGVFGWRMENMELGGVWDERHVMSGQTIHDIGDKVEELLPPPENFAGWALDKL